MPQKVKQFQRMKLGLLSLLMGTLSSSSLWARHNPPPLLYILRTWGVFENDIWSHDFWRIFPKTTLMMCLRKVNFQKTKSAFQTFGNVTFSFQSNISTREANRGLQIWESNPINFYSEVIPITGNEAYRKVWIVLQPNAGHFSNLKDKDLMLAVGRR